MGEVLLGDVDERALRLCAGLGGGVGATHEELCGALSGGVLLIGARHGFAPGEDKRRCYGLAARFRERFVEALGATRCQDLRDQGYGSDAKPCSLLVEQAARILIATLASEA